ncbi:hypothetical protein HKD37_05G013125 [Glycine soja]
MRSYPTTISNSLKASKLLINQPMPEIEEFKQRLTELKITVRPVLTSRSQATEAKSLSEINKILHYFGIVCVTVGTIGRIVMENHSWCYAACIQCNKKTNIDNTPFTCACGKYNQQAMLRYRLEVMVYHKEECTKFLLSNRECTDLIGQSVDEVNRLKIAGIHMEATG